VHLEERVHEVESNRHANKPHEALQAQKRTEGAASWKPVRNCWHARIKKKVRDKLRGQEADGVMDHGVSRKYFWQGMYETVMHRPDAWLRVRGKG